MTYIQAEKELLRIVEYKIKDIVESYKLRWYRGLKIYFDVSETEERCLSDDLEIVGNIGLKELEKIRAIEFEEDKDNSFYYPPEYFEALNEVLLLISFIDKMTTGCILTTEMILKLVGESDGRTGSN